tara:strand:+ start:493 stop:702 length:210 start_codon:yes stop_codon:yes gene_type:complete
MDRFKHPIQQGSDISGVIYAAGYGSISRIYGEATRSMGMTPKVYRVGAAGAKHLLYNHHLPWSYDYGPD